MKILQINSVCGVTGTGRIVTDLYDTAVSGGHDCMIAYGEHKFHNDPGQEDDRNRINARLQDACDGNKTLGRSGICFPSCNNRIPEKVEEYHPDVVHLHNLHGYYINIELLFRYLKQKKIKVVWTLHDCWPFTGHCVHFQQAGCNKWKEKCHHCPLTRQYPASMGIDRSRQNYLRKKEAFTGIEDMTLLVPSYWLAERVKESFLKDYPVRVIYNGIDLDIYRPTPSDFRKNIIWRINLWFWELPTCG